MHLLLHIIAFIIAFFFCYSIEHSLTITSPWFEGIRWWSSFHFFEEKVARILRADNPVYIWMLRYRWTGYTHYGSIRPAKNPIMFGRRPIRAIVKLIRNVTGYAWPSPKFVRSSYGPRTDWFTTRNTIFNEIPYIYIKEVFRRRTRRFIALRKRLKRVFYWNRRSPDLVVKNFFHFNFWYKRRKYSKVGFSPSRLKFFKKTVHYNLIKYKRLPKTAFFKGSYKTIKLNLFMYKSKYYNLSRVRLRRPLDMFPPRFDRMLYHFYVDRIILNQPKFKSYCFNRAQSRRSGRIFP